MFQAQKIIIAIITATGIIIPLLLDLLLIRQKYTGLIMKK